MHQVPSLSFCRFLKIISVAAALVTALLAMPTEAAVSSSASIRMTAQAPVICRMETTGATAGSGEILVSLSAFCNAKHTARAFATADGYGFEDAVFTMDGKRVPRNDDGSLVLYRDAPPRNGASLLRISAPGIERRNVALRVEVDGSAF